VDVEALIAEGPAFHRDARGNPLQLGADPEVLRSIDATVNERSATLETGAGISTVLFAIKRAQHTCVVYSVDEIEAIKRWCAGHGISTDSVDFRWGRSEHVLPTLDPQPLDLVFVDGTHAFPSPFIDWYYAGRRLVQGGTLIVDDIHLWTGIVLRKFLIEQPGWDLVKEVPWRSAIFRRTGDLDELQEWVAQPFVRRRSITGRQRDARIALTLLRRGGLVRALRRRLAGRR
jgi:predicted O-methyltransferase YrrM